MAKKSRLHEFEKNNRVINIPQAQDARRERLEIARQKKAVNAQEEGQDQLHADGALRRSFWSSAISFVVSAVKIVRLQGEKKEVAARE